MPCSGMLWRVMVLLILLGFAAWFALPFPLAVAVGRAFREAGREQTPPPPTFGLAA